MNIKGYPLSSSYPVFKPDSRSNAGLRAVLGLLSSGGQDLHRIRPNRPSGSRINIDYPVSGLSTPKGGLSNWIAPIGAYPFCVYLGRQQDSPGMVLGSPWAPTGGDVRVRCLTTYDYCLGYLLYEQQRQARNKQKELGILIVTGEFAWRCFISARNLKTDLLFPFT